MITKKHAPRMCSLYRTAITHATRRGINGFVDVVFTDAVKSNMSS